MKRLTYRYPMCFTVISVSRELKEGSQYDGRPVKDFIGGYRQQEYKDEL